jgi:hypothetical protein
LVGEITLGEQSGLDVYYVKTFAPERTPGIPAMPLPPPQPGVERIVRPIPIMFIASTVPRNTSFVHRSVDPARLRRAFDRGTLGA